MHQWTQERQFKQDGLVVTIQRNEDEHYPERLVSATKDGVLVDHARVSWNVWKDHGDGATWLPAFVEHALAKATHGPDPLPDPDTGALP
jgi:hypothetical protein